MWSLALGESLVAIGAIGGAVAMFSGSIDRGASINRRLPFESPAFGATALLLVVGLPMSVAALSCWRRRRLFPDLAIVSGLLLMAWIAVEMSVIRSFSPLQPTFFLTGLSITICGYRMSKRSKRATEE